MVSHTTDNNLKLSLSNVNFFCSISLECAKTEIMIIVARDKICLLEISTLKETSPPILDFMKRTSVVEMNFSGYKKYASKVAKMANIENLEGHKLSIKIRQNDKK